MAFRCGVAGCRSEFDASLRLSADLCRSQSCSFSKLAASAFHSTARGLLFLLISLAGAAACAQSAKQRIALRHRQRGLDQ